MRSLVLAAVVAVLGLGGCYSYEHAQYDCDGTFQATYGQPVDSVITTYGAPTNVRVIEGGHREYHWDHVRVVARDGHEHHAYGVNVVAHPDGHVVRHEIREVRR